MRGLTIIYRHWFFPLCIALLINEALVQCVHMVHAVAGQTVILPCYTQAISSAYWRYNDSRTVCDIVKGKVYFDEQHSVYKDKVDYFPEELRKGNFSIKLLDVNSAHQGIYTCNFPNTLIPEITYLIVKEVRPRVQKAVFYSGDTRLHAHIFLLFSGVLLGLYSI
ncbi:CD276 antigen homolog [Tachysurus vachellii]|uniref:CD276 antigen homolog n=1 Tax=Tachysurus vachellii TaxID=175792 RepID=UPI00296B4EA5|nr:CD276 antigen homolog [Tachysurus vachellii]